MVVVNSLHEINVESMAGSLSTFNVNFSSPPLSTEPLSPNY